MYLDNLLDDEEPFMSPQSSAANMNFKPSLNNKFKKRLFNKPLQLDQRRLSRLNQALASYRNESSDSSYKIPSINKPLAGRSSRVAKLLKSNTKSLNTSRNRNLSINMSGNGIPHLREQLRMSNGNPNLMFTNDMVNLGNLFR